MQDFSIMKKALIFAALFLIVGGWTANKFVTQSSKSSEEKERFLEYSSDYGYDAEAFLSAQTKLHHDEAFATAYRKWKLSPISEIDLEDKFDQKNYYLTLGKIISEAAKTEGQSDAYNALIDIGKHYGVPPTPKDPPKVAKPTAAAPSTPTTTTDSALGKSKLGDKRAIPSSRRRDDDR